MASGARGGARTVDRREEERRDIAIAGEMLTLSTEHVVTIVDLSAQGCRLHSPDAAFIENSPVEVRLGPIGPLDARMKWYREDIFGLHFDKPLHPAVLDHIRAHFDVRHLGRGQIDRYA